MAAGVAESWGRYPQAEHRILPLHWINEPLPRFEGKGLPFGLGRSYGDSCLNAGGVLLVTTGLDRLISFDVSSGLLRCEGGVTLENILKLIVPRGWFLPTTPGTKFVTVGGAIANDIHGKNHHRAGSFGCHVTQFELLRSDGTRMLCSPKENAEWFVATIGGLGLTGLITWAEFRLRPLQNPLIDMESIKFHNLDEFFQLTAESDQNFEYTVSWVDCLARGKAQGRGIFMRGNHSNAQTNTAARTPSRRLNVPCVMPSLLLNHYSMAAFNFAYYWKSPLKKCMTTHYDPFFYPLDFIGNWNRIYGPGGFFQYQLVVPFTHGRDVVGEILARVAASKRGTFLVVLKTFGDVPSPGMLSFPRPGVTLTLDFPNRGQPTLKLFEEFDEVVMQAGGRIYPAKDARMSASVFQQGFPEWQNFRNYIDPAFSSSFWRRVTS